MATKVPPNTASSKTAGIVITCVLAAALVVLFAVAIGLGMKKAAVCQTKHTTPRGQWAVAPPVPAPGAVFDPLAPPLSCERTVIVEVQYGTGNVLFQLAHALALCRIHRAGLWVHSPAGPDFASQHAAPKGLFGAFHDRQLRGPVPKDAVKWEENSDWGLGLLDRPWPAANPRHVFVTGTHQCTAPLYAAGAVHYLAALLRFSKDDHKARRDLVASTPHGARNVCLHIRRGDYLQAYWQQQFTNLTPQYYTRSMQRVAGPTRVCVFSDDLPWCRKQPWLSQLPNVWFEPKGLTVTATLCTMAACDCFILSNSTFALWGALLAHVRSADSTFVQVPLRWFKPFRSYNVRHMYVAHPAWVHVDDTSGEVGAVTSTWAVKPQAADLCL